VTGPKGIFFGSAAREYLDRLRETWPHDEELAEEHGVSADNGRFLTAIEGLEIAVSY
jgi:hypothetical protein